MRIKGVYISSSFMKCVIGIATLVVSVIFRHTAYAVTCDTLGYEHNLPDGSYREGTCTFHCPPPTGDYNAEDCLYIYWFEDYTCEAGGHPNCPTSCYLVSVRDYNKKTCLCQGLAGCNPTTESFGPLITCYPCLGS